MAMAMEVSMQNDTASMNNEVIEIDLLQLISDIWKAVRSYGWLLLALISILGTIGFFIARSVYTPYYEAYTTFTVNTVSSVNFNSRNQKNTVTNKIGQIFPYILTSDALRSLVIEDMGYEDGETFPAEIKGKAVAVCGAGTFGQQLVRRMEQSGQYNIVGWYDEDYREYRRCCMNVDPMSDISVCRFDYILIAKLDRASVNAYRRELLDLGISHEKILAIEPSKEARRQALDIYLNEDAGGNSD